MTFIAICFVGLWTGSTWAQNPGTDFSLDQYLEEVRRFSPDVQAGGLNRRGAELRENEGSLLYAPTLGLTAAYVDDQRYTTAPVFMGTRSVAQTAGLTLSQLTSWGMAAKFSYNLTATNVSGATALPVPIYTILEPRLEITQSLWSNGFGAGTRAQKAVTDASNRMTAFTETFKLKQLVLRAELAYWRLAFSRRTVEIQREVLNRSKTLLEWVSGRTRLNLSDRSDLLQVQAAYQLRKMELASAEDEERVAALEFNKVRGKEGREVVEKLVLASASSLRGLNVPGETADHPPHPREDVLAARAGEEAGVANNVLAQERNRPTLDVSLSYGGNGLDPTFGSAFSQSWNFSHPYAALQLKFSMPLAFGRQSDIREGYELGKRASGFLAAKADLDAAQEWRDLTRGLSDVRKRLALAEELAQLQRTKLEYERDRLRRGRSVTSQIIQFEQDYLQSELNLVRVSSEMLRVFAQLKLFGGSP